MIDSKASCFSATLGNIFLFYCFAVSQAVEGKQAHGLLLWAINSSKAANFLFRR